jgi:hypothetical protein
VPFEADGTSRLAPCDLTMKAAAEQDAGARSLVMTAPLSGMPFSGMK